MKAKRGKAQSLGKCCREIRIQTPNNVGEIYSGFNTHTEELEYWECIKTHKDTNKNIMQRVFINTLKD